MGGGLRTSMWVTSPDLGLIFEFELLDDDEGERTEEGDLRGGRNGRFDAAIDRGPLGDLL